MDDADVFALAALAQEGLGPGRLARLRAAFGSLASASRAAAAGRNPPDGVPDDAFARLTQLDLVGARGRLEEARAAGVTVVGWEHPAYPAPLRVIPRPPQLLFVQGTLPPVLAQPVHRVRTAAIVGTRRPTGRGKELAHELAASLAQLSVCVVSGLALGIDAAAHEGALAAGGRTVAVLGGGHGHLHPPAHRGLADRMLAAGGAVISEHLPDVRPDRHHFPHRNRIVSGLARLVVVVEAGLRSGTASTVDHALEQDRQVFACPGRPGDPSVAGTLRFLSEGAHVVADLEDVLMHFRDGAAAAPPHPPDAILEALAPVDEATLDDLGRALNEGAATLLARLTALELSGAVVRTAAGRYRLAAEIRRRYHVGAAASVPERKRS